MVDPSWPRRSLSLSHVPTLAINICLLALTAAGGARPPPSLVFFQLTGRCKLVSSCSTSEREDLIGPERRRSRADLHADRKTSSSIISSSSPKEKMTRGRKRDKNKDWDWDAPLLLSLSPNCSGSSRLDYFLRPMASELNGQ